MSRFLRLLVRPGRVAGDSGVHLDRRQEESASLRYLSPRLGVTGFRVVIGAGWELGVLLAGEGARRLSVQSVHGGVPVRGVRPQRLAVAGDLARRSAGGEDAHDSDSTDRYRHDSLHSWSPPDRLMTDCGLTSYKSQARTSSSHYDPPLDAVATPD